MYNNLNTSVERRVSPPQIWEFMDPVEYLRAYFEHKKTEGASFSYGLWAERIGLKSRSFLRLVLVRKRNLTEETAELISKSVEHSALERQYFINLVRLSRAGTISEREIPGRELVRLRKRFALKTQNTRELRTTDLFEFLASYKIPRLQVLLTIDGIKKTEDRLAGFLNLKEQDVQQMLAILQRLDLAEKTGSGEWSAKESKLVTADVLGNVALQSFHKKSLEEAIESIGLPVEVRRFQSLVLALTSEQFESVNSEIRQFLEGLLQKYGSSQKNDKDKLKIYQLNLNLIPVTRSIFRESEPSVESPERKEVENESKK